MTRMPVLFLSHGSPMMALKTPDADPYVHTLAELGKKLPTPRAICLISAHWYTRGKYVSVSTHPEAIHDFGGFPEALYTLEYSCPGFPEGAKLLQETTPGILWQSVERGIDHGGWTVLRHLFPDADIPVFSISMDRADTMEQHFLLGEKLRVLRDRGILIIATGNTVHNLSDVDFSREAYGSLEAQEFDGSVKTAVESRDYRTLLDPGSLPSGRYAVPTPEHYIPLLAILGASYPDENPEWIYEGHELGGVSRMAVGFFG